jgi:hypothetical protein
MHVFRPALLLAVLLQAAFGQERLPDQFTENFKLLRLPPGFRISLYSQNKVPGARHLALGLARGNSTIVYVSSNTAGSVSAANEPPSLAP